MLGERIDLGGRDPCEDHRREVQRHDVARPAALGVLEERAPLLGHELDLRADELLAHGGEDLEIVSDRTIAIPLDLGVRGLHGLDRRCVVHGRQDVGQQRGGAGALRLIDARAGRRRHLRLATDGSLDLGLVRGGVEGLAGLEVDGDERLLVATPSEQPGPVASSADGRHGLVVGERAQVRRLASQDLRRPGSTLIRRVAFPKLTGVCTERDRDRREAEHGGHRERQQTAQGQLLVRSLAVPPVRKAHLP